MKKFLVIALALMLSLSCLFAGCGSMTINAFESAEYDANKDQLVVATNAAFAPFEYKMGNKFAGIDMEIAKGLADYLGWEIVIKDMDFDAVVTSVGKNGIDIAMAGLTVNEKRKESVNFTDSYYNASQVVIVKDGDTSLDGLTTKEAIDAAINVAGVKIGVQTGTTGEVYVNGDLDQGEDGFGFEGLANAEAKPYANAGLAVQDLKNGAVNYVIVDEAPAKAIAASMGGVKVINVALTVEEYAFGVAKDQPNLLAKVNEYLAKIKSDGTYDKIAEKYFSQEINEDAE